jgi:hypothetical protein
MARLPRRVRDRVDQLTDDLATMDGVPSQSLSPGQRLHYQKMALDAAIDGLKREGLDGVSLRALMGVKKAFLEGIDEALPGYQQARKVWAGLAEEQEALEAGQKVFGGAQGANADVAPDRVAADLAELSDAGKAMFEAGVRSAMRGLMQAADKGGRTNVTNALASTARRNVIRAALGPARAEKFFTALTEEAKLFEASKQMLPGVNSKTFRQSADALDEIATNPASRLSPAQMMKSLFGAVTSPMAEGWRNKTGQALLTPIDSGLPNYDPRQVEALREAMRKAMARQAAATRTATAQGAGAGFTATSGANNSGRRD